MRDKAVRPLGGWAGASLETRIAKGALSQLHSNNPKTLKMRDHSDLSCSILFRTLKRAAGGLGCAITISRSACYKNYKNYNVEYRCGIEMESLYSISLSTNSFFDSALIPVI